MLLDMELLLHKEMLREEDIILLEQMSLVGWDEVDDIIAEHRLITFTTLTYGLV